jgi:hypothetical protein
VWRVSFPARKKFERFNNRKILVCDSWASASADVAIAWRVDSARLLAGSLAVASTLDERPLSISSTLPKNFWRL